VHQTRHTVKSLLLFKEALKIDRSKDTQQLTVEMKP